MRLLTFSSFSDLSENRLNLEDGFPFVPSLVELYALYFFLNLLRLACFFRHLGANGITQLKENQFKNVSSVQSLGLMDNVIHIIHSKSFNDLTNLTELYVQSNQKRVGVSIFSFIGICPTISSR